MPSSSLRLLVTGANGQLGRLVVDDLLAAGGGHEIHAIVRRQPDADALAARGVKAHIADYAKPETLDAAFQGIDRVLLISSSEIGQRGAQHGNVIDAARRAGVKLLAYTSLLHADTSPLGVVAHEHQETEQAIRASGIPFVFLRNSWYTDNYVMGLQPALQHGVIMGSAGQGRVAAASRADYAAAAAAVLLSNEDQAGRVYELAGDTDFSMSDLAGFVSQTAGKPVAYKDLPQADYKAALAGFGLPETMAGLLAEADVGISKGGLAAGAHDLSRLIGRPTTPWQDTVRAALKG